MLKKTQEKRVQGNHRAFHLYQKCGNPEAICTLYSDRKTKATAWPKSYQIDTLDRRTPEALQVEVSRSDKETDDKHKDILSQGLWSVFQNKIWLVYH